MWDRRAVVTNVHDGDTITVVLDQGFGDTKEITLRLQGVYAPELKQVGGPEVRQYVQDWLLMQGRPGEWPVVVTTARTRTDREVTTLGRYVGIVTSIDGSRNLNLDTQAYITAQGYAGGVGS